MKKITRIILFSILISILTINVSFGETMDDFVRIRIRSPRRFNQQAELEGYGLIKVYDLSSGTTVELLQLENKLSILMDSYFDSKNNFLENNSLNNALVGPIHVRISDKKFSTYNEVKNEINNVEQQIGDGFYPYYNGSNFYIYYGAFTNVSSADNIINKLREAGLSGETVNGNKKSVVVYNSQDEIVFSYTNNLNVYFTSINEKLPCNMIKIDGKPYRGHMAFNIINDTTMISINRLDIESYLYGVVPSESPASWPIEALKAQTLAARTYAMAHLKPFASYGYDMQDNTYDQVYGGYASEYASTNRAVDETKGEKIYYNGKLIDAVFHSTSGGSTENSENVWINALPYLRGVEDEYSNISPITQWEEVYTKEDIVKRLNLYENGVKELYGIEIASVTENNRVQECIFHTDKGKITYTKDSIRSVLGLRSLWFTIEGDKNNEFYFLKGSGNPGNVPSRGIIDAITDQGESETEEKQVSKDLNGLYVISDSKTSAITNTDNLYFISSSGVSNVSRDSGKSDGTYVIEGRGWGHGLGMSQYGAKQMATEGFTYDEIIKHYYTGVNIK